MYSIKKIAVISAFLGMVLLSCSNILISSLPEEKGLKITISGDAVNSRTLYPEVSFSKFVINFNSPLFNHDDITLQGDTFSVTVRDIEEGKWVITVTGYVRIRGIEYPAATGSGEININPDQPQNLNIPISARQEPGINGFVSYSITWPEAKANYGNLEITPFNNNSLSGRSFSLSSSPASGNISLAPGFYVFILRFYCDYRTVVRAEIIHVYSGLETNAQYVLSDDDFNEYVIISGTIDVKVNSNTPDSVYLRAVMKKEEFEISYCWVNMDNNTWSIILPVFESDVTISINIEFVTIDDFTLYPGRKVYDVIVRDNNITDIALGVFDIKAITLSGTINVTYNNNPIENVYIYSNYFSGGSSARLSSPDAYAPWSIMTLSFDTPTEIFFHVIGEHYLHSDNNNFYERIFSRDIDTFSVNVFDQDKSGINIDMGNFSSIPNNPVPLDNNIWVDGEIIEKYVHDWYSTDVTGGTEYYIWWNDTDSGIGIKSLDVDVYAYYSNGTPIYLGNNDSAWNYPASFTARSNDTVNIRVRSRDGNENTGTYAIAYSTGNARPGIGEFTGTLAQKLEWIKLNTTGGDYTIVLDSDETIDPQKLSFNYDEVSITLIGDGTERIISLENSSDNMFRIEQKITLILDNNITLKGSNDNNYSLIYVSSGGNLVMNTGSKITGNNGSFYEGGVIVNEGTFIMNGGEIYDNTSYSGGGVYIYGGTFIMNGGEIYDNTSYSGGGVFVRNENVTFTMTGGKIYGNTSDYGGGVYLSSGIFTMTGGEIYGNSASDSGGGVYVVSGTFTMTDGEIYGNTAFYYGGGVYVNSGTFTKTGGGTITGYGSFTSPGDDSVFNAVKDISGIAQNNFGHAVYINKDGVIIYRRETTAGPTDNLNSNDAGSTGGWE